MVVDDITSVVVAAEQVDQYKLDTKVYAWSGCFLAGVPIKTDLDRQKLNGERRKGRRGVVIGTC